MRYISTTATSNIGPVMKWDVSQDFNRLGGDFAIEFPGTPIITADTRINLDVVINNATIPKLRQVKPTKIGTRVQNGEVITVVSGTWTQADAVLNNKPQAPTRTTPEQRRKARETEQRKIQKMLETAPKKTYYLLSARYLNEVIGSGNWWVDQNAIMMRAYNVGSYHISAHRYDLPDLPDETVDKNTYEFQVAQTHHMIASWICNQSNVRFRSNTPDMYVYRYMKLEPTQTWWDILQSMFNIWNPAYSFYYHEFTKSPIFEVCDVYGTASSPQKSDDLETFWTDDGTPTSDYTEEGVLKLKKRKFSSVSVPVSMIENINIAPNSELAETEDEKDKIDHVIVKGYEDNKEGDKIGIMELVFETEQSEVSYTETISQSYVCDLTLGTANKQMNERTKGFNKTKAPPLKTPSMTVHEEGYGQDKKSGKLILLREAVHKYASDGTLLLSTYTNHRYGEGGRLLSTVESDYGFVTFPGNDGEFTFINYRNRLIDQSRIMVGLNVALKNEVIEEYVLFEKIKTKKSKRVSKSLVVNEYDEYDAAPKLLMSAVQEGSVDRSKATRQQTETMTTLTKSTRINRVSSSLLRQIEVEYNRLTNTVKIRAELIENPVKEAQEKPTKFQFVREYFEGAAPYHKAIEVTHPDISTDTIAQEIAKRVFNKYNRGLATEDIFESDGNRLEGLTINKPNDEYIGPLKEIQVDLICPFVFQGTAFQVRLPNIPHGYFTLNGLQQSGTIYSEIYFLTNISESGEPGNMKCSLTLRSNL